MEFQLDRREFLKYVAGAATALAYPFNEVLDAASATCAATGRSVPTTQPAKSTVILVSSSKSLRGGTVNRQVLRTMISDGLCELTGASSLPVAVRRLFSPKDVIGFKFDSVGDDVLQINQPVCEELLRLFVGQCGFDESRLVFIGARPDAHHLPRPAGASFGWTRPVNFGSGRDQLAVVLEKITALVNVPLLRADAITGIGGCLKNVTYGFLRHPARFYGNACTPYLADIYSLPIIRDKVRFNMVNALRLLIRSDVLDAPNAVATYGRLLFSFDPVAVDATCVEIIEHHRAKAKLPALLSGRDLPRHVVAAWQRGIGQYHGDRVSVKRLRVH